MSSHPPPPPSKRPAGSPDGQQAPREVERALALRDVMQHAVQVEKAAAAAGRVPGSRGHAIVVLCGVLLLACAWSVVFRPEFIWGRPASMITAEREEAAVRFAMHLLARRAESFRMQHGAYPSATELAADSTIRYTLVGDSQFRIAASVRGRPVVLTSSDDLAAFLGNSVALIQQGVAR